MSKIKVPQGSSKKVAGRRPKKHAQSEQLPGYLKEVKEISLNNNFSSEDYVWIGEREEKIFNPEQLLKKEGFEPEGPLRLLLKAIIAAHESEDGASFEDRLSQAERALLGQRGKRGNRIEDDEDILREVGRRYFERWHANQNLEIEVAPIVREVLADLEICKPMVEGQSIVRRLQTKFSRGRDRILARVTYDMQWELPEFHRRMRRVLSDLEALGVQVDRSVLEKRIGQTLK